MRRDLEGAPPGPRVDEPALAARPVELGPAFVDRVDALDQRRARGRDRVEPSRRSGRLPLERDAVAPAAHRDDAAVGPVHREERLGRAARHARERSFPVPMQNGAARADDPYLVALTPHLEEAGDLVMRDAREIEREPLLLERAVVVVPDEAVAPRRAADRVEVVGRRPPDPVDRLLPQPGRRQALEAPLRQAQHGRARARHQRAPVGERVHPPKVPLRACLELLPARAVEVEHERPVPLVRADRVHVRRRRAVDGEERRRQAGRYQLPRRLDGLDRSRRGWLRAGRREQAHEGDHRSLAHGFLRVGATWMRTVDDDVPWRASTTVVVTSRGFPRNWV